MLTATAIYQGDLRVKNIHEKSETVYVTDAPTDNEGKGESFSPTDTVAVALANCMLTIMGIKARQRKVDLVGTYAKVTKHMIDKPRRIGRIEVSVYFSLRLDEKQQQLFERAALSCPVFHSLHPDIEKDIQFHYPDA